MSARNRFYRKGPIDIPSVFVSVCWIAIWLVWPVGRESYSSTGSSARMKLRYVKVGVEECMQGESVFMNNLGVMADRGVVSNTLDRYKEKETDDSWKRRGQAVISAEMSEKTLLNKRFVEADGKYDPNWRGTPAFTTDVFAWQQIVWQVSGDLKNHEYKTPSLPESLTGINKAWQVTVSVDAGINGWPEHVFVETSSGDQEIDDKVVRVVYQIRFLNMDKACGGFVTVGFEGKKTL